MGRITAYDQNGHIVADFDKSRMDYLCDGYLYLKSYWCRACDERFAYRNIRDKEAAPKYCPNCGCEVRA